MEDKEKLRQFLFSNSMEGNWKNVVDKYSKDPNAHDLEIIKSKDTALHLAVLHKEEEIVAVLVSIICRAGNEKVLAKQNEAKNTPLHLAAALGSARMCSDIASAYGSVLDIRNDDHETPLFSAALHGHKDVFLILYSFCSSTTAPINSRKSDGDSVLHCAVRKEHFDLAFQIINLNKDSVNWVNEEGHTALHDLARNPDAFASGSHIGGWRKIVYYCTHVDPLKPESASAYLKKLPLSGKVAKSPKRCFFPDNYETCVRFFTKLWHGFLIASTLKRFFTKKNYKNGEAENAADLEKDVARESAKNMKEAHERPDTGLPEEDQPGTIIFPENYSTCFNLLVIIFEATMTFLGFGSIEIRNIQEKKEKHAWSVQVLNKLLEFSSMYKYSDDGNIPLASRFQTDEETGTRPYRFDGGEIAFNILDVAEDPTKNQEDQKNALDVAEDPTKNQEDQKNALDVAEDPTKNQEDQKNAQEKEGSKGKETAMLLAGKNGVVEIVRGIFKLFPVAIHDVNNEKKNILHLAAENRQPAVYTFLLENKYLMESVFRAVDNQGNSALHLAADMGASKPWGISGSALQMQWEYKWYQFVKGSVPPHCFARYNEAGDIAENIFHEKHRDLATKGGDWLIKTSESFSVVAGLIATVAFASAATIPGGTHGEEGTPILKGDVVFGYFVISSWFALYLSLTSVIMFLSILTSRFKDSDFGLSLAWKLLVGLSSLFFAIVAILISFCASHYFMLHRELQNMAAVLYILTCVPVALIFLFGQLPLYADLIGAILKKVPEEAPKPSS